MPPDELAPIDAAMAAMAEDMAALVEPRHPDEVLTDYYSRRSTELDSDAAAVEAKFDLLEQAIMAARQGMLGDIDRRRAALEWHAGREVREIVANEIEGRKAKSIKTPWGTLGYRTKPGRISLVVDDKAAAIEWAGKALPDILKFTPSINTAEAIKAIIDGKAIPGARVEMVEAEEVFYAKPATLKVLPATEQKGLE